MKSVLILYKFLPQYRLEFFDKLKADLNKENVELILIYGKLKNKDSKKNDERELDWAIFRNNKTLHIGDIELIWQPSLDMLPKIDLVIVEQANRLLVNYLLITLSKVMNFKFAYWGHGANMQIAPNNIKNKFKYFFINKCDHWFAYTKGVKKLLINKGVHDKNITVVNNAIDTNALKKEYELITNEKIDEMKNKMGIESNNVGLYCGGIYKEKRIDFLLGASKKIKEKIKDFNLIVIGAGHESYKIINASKRYDWIHYVGPRFDLDKVPFFRISSLFLMPGAVGLAILDSFAMQTPMITTDIPFHGPEIEYLVDDINGIVTLNNINDYSKQVINTYKNKDKMALLSRGCVKSSNLYNNENMVENFKNGVLSCLEN